MPARLNIVRWLHHMTMHESRILDGLSGPSGEVTE